MSILSSNSEKTTYYVIFFKYFLYEHNIFRYLYCYIYTHNDNKYAILSIEINLP